MKKRVVLVGIVFTAIAFFEACQDKEPTLRPWTTAETDLFHTQSLPENAGSRWVDNTLKLNYGGGDGSSGGVYGKSRVYPAVENFIPANAIGISFCVSVTSEFSSIVVGARGRAALNADANIDIIVIHRAATGCHDRMNFQSVVERLPNGNWLSGEYFDDIPESTENGKTTVELVFVRDIITAPQLEFVFEANSCGTSQTGVPYLAGTTTFSDVSWIIDNTSTPAYFPDPTLPAQAEEMEKIARDQRLEKLMKRQSRAVRHHEFQAQLVLAKATNELLHANYHSSEKLRAAIESFDRTSTKLAGCMLGLSVVMTVLVLLQLLPKVLKWKESRKNKSNRHGELPSDETRE